MGGIISSPYPNVNLKYTMLYNDIIQTQGLPRHYSTRMHTPTLCRLYLQILYIYFA